MNLRIFFKTRSLNPQIFLIAAIFFMGMLLRFVLLGQPSLINPEADLAFQALASAQSSTGLIGGQPGYVSLTTLLFFLFGGSDYLARFWPAFFGIALILVPFLFQNILGKRVALVLAALIALDPGLLSFSRTADGAMIAVSAGLWASGFFFMKRKLISATLLGLAIICGLQFSILLLTFGLAFMISKKFRLSFALETETRVLNEFKNVKIWDYIAIIISALIISSMFLFHPNGISGIGTTLNDYFQSWTGKSGLSALNSILLLIISELPVLVLGIWGLVRGILKRNSTYLFLGLWWSLGLCLAIANPSRSASTIVFANIPILILAAMQIVDLLGSIQIPNPIVGLSQLAATLSLIFFSMFNFINLMNFPETDPILFRNRLIGTLLPLGLLLMLTLLLAWGWNVESTKSGLLTGLCILLAAVLLGSAWKAAGFGSRPENEISRNGPYVIGNHLFLQSITDLSRWNQGQAKTIDVQLVGLDCSSVRWALRDFESVTQEKVFSPNSTPSIVVTGMDTLLTTENQYRGQRVIWSVKPDFQKMQFRDWVLWFFFRNSPEERSELILWARNDLFKNSDPQ
ncbi:MAG: hypothetical protein NTZ74_08505 [Chloroflexi bacterium]|nr:hypothetical protein [Chloroflexota bacterium]